MKNLPTYTRKLKPNWLNISFLAAVHVLAIFGVWYMIFVNLSWATIVLAMSLYLACSLSITAGYHRLFAHRAYTCSRKFKLLLLVGATGALQGSAQKWPSDHRNHHAYTDTARDPYNIMWGFWWAHIGWVLFNTNDQILNFDNIKDLSADQDIAWQHRWYFPLGAAVAFGLPILIGSLWHDMLGAFLIAGCLRLLIQYHSTFAVNSVAHWTGSQPYSTKTSARNSWLTALVTFGEGNHNAHHAFPSDYRNGFKWYEFDPTKWFIWTLATIGLAKNLKKTPIQILTRAISKIDNA